MGYSPPGEGAKSDEAWTKLEQGFPCNPSLGTSYSQQSSSSQQNVDVEGSASSSFQDVVITEKPTNRPTSIEDLPSLISGAVWHDSNGDGWRNTVDNALTLEDYSAAGDERGAGISNYKVTLRECGSDRLMGVTYTFPRASGGGGDASAGRVNPGGEQSVEIVGADYLEAINQQKENSLSYGGAAVADDRLGIGNTDGKIGYYSFRVLPHQIPGDFYIVFEAPRGYRLSAGSGLDWEVHRTSYDTVQPLMDKEWERNQERSLQESNQEERFLQVLNGTLVVDKELVYPPNDAEPVIPSQPTSFSGLYARSRDCFSIQKSPTHLINVDVGLTKDTWPLVPYQYASFVVVIKFYATEQRRLQKVSVECRKFQKLKSEGIPVDDLWGCTDQGKSKENEYNFEKLNLAQGSAVATAMRDFLQSRIARVWTVKNVGLTHQEMIMLKSGNSDDGNRRNLGLGNIRRDQTITHISNLELGFRVRAEYTLASLKSKELTDVVTDLVEGNTDGFLSGVKAITDLPTYFRMAGSMDVRDVLWKPAVEVSFQTREPVEGELERLEGFDMNEFLEGGTQDDKEGNIDAGTSFGMVVGVVCGLVSLLLVVVGGIMYVKRKQKAAALAKSKFKQQSMQKQRATRNLFAEPQQQKKKWRNARGNRRRNSSDSSSSDEESYLDDYEANGGYVDEYGSDSDLSSRWFSDSSKYDPDAVPGKPRQPPAMIGGKLREAPSNKFDVRQSYVQAGDEDSEDESRKSRTKKKKKSKGRPRKQSRRSRSSSSSSRSSVSTGMYA